MRLPSLAELTYAGAILGFLYSVIVRRKRIKEKTELTIYLEGAFAGLAIAPAIYLIACGFKPQLLLQIPGYQYYVGIGGLAALYFAIYKLAFTIRTVDPPSE